VSCAERSGSSLARGAGNVKRTRGRRRVGRDLLERGSREDSNYGSDGASSTRHEDETIRLQLCIPPQGVISQSISRSVRCSGRRCRGVVEEGLVTRTVSRRIGTASKKEKRFVSVPEGIIYLPHQTTLYSVVLVARNASIYRLPPAAQEARV
jgi:hypothetical protein